MDSTLKRILFFDGDCTMCNRWVDFVLTHEQKPEVQFASLQSEFCRSFFNKNGYDYNVDSIVYWDGIDFHIKSRAILELSTFLSPPYNKLIWAKFIPKFMRDGVYNLVARNRNKFLKNKALCRLPSIEERARFL